MSMRYASGVLILLIFGCQNTAKLTQLQDGQELHGGDLAVAKVRTSVLLNFPNWKQSEILMRLMTEPAYSEEDGAKALAVHSASGWRFHRSEVFRSDPKELIVRILEQVRNDFPEAEGLLRRLTLQEATFPFYLSPQTFRFDSSLQLEKLSPKALLQRSERNIAKLGVCLTSMPTDQREALGLSALVSKRLASFSSAKIVVVPHPLRHPKSDHPLDFAFVAAPSPTIFVSAPRLAEIPQLSLEVWDYLLFHEYAHSVLSQSSGEYDDNYLVASHAFAACYPWSENYLAKPFGKP